MIKSFDQYQNYDKQSTSATGYYGAMADRFQKQSAMGVPRSAGAWDAERAQLGSWNTGVAAPMRNSTGYQSGMGNPLFDYSGGRNTSTGGPADQRVTL